MKMEQNHVKEYIKMENFMDALKYGMKMEVFALMQFLIMENPMGCSKYLE